MSYIRLGVLVNNFGLSTKTHSSLEAHSSSGGEVFEQNDLLLRSRIMSLELGGDLVCIFRIQLDAIFYDYSPPSFVRPRNTKCEI